jgi:hypothetical protein
MSVGNVIIPALGDEFGFSPFSAIPPVPQLQSVLALPTVGPSLLGNALTGVLFSVTKQLSINDVHSLNTVPVVMLAGIPGYIIMPVHLQWISNVTAAITTSQSGNLQYSVVGNLISAAVSTVTTGVTGRKAGLAVMTTITFPAGTDLNGASVQLVGTAACTGGAGTFQATMAYYLLPAIP